MGGKGPKTKEGRRNRKHCIWAGLPCGTSILIFWRYLVFLYFYFSLISKTTTEKKNVNHVLRLAFQENDSLASPAKVPIGITLLG